MKKAFHFVLYSVLFVVAFTTSAYYVMIIALKLRRVL